MEGQSYSEETRNELRNTESMDEGTQIGTKHNIAKRGIPETEHVSREDVKPRCDRGLLEKVKEEQLGRGDVVQAPSRVQVETTMLALCHENTLPSAHKRENKEVGEE